LIPSIQTQVTNNETRSAMKKRPNIVYILADDWGYGDVSCLNPDSKIPTPYTDAFAAQGMIFSDMHSNSAVCTPTRYGILTGRYCWRGHLKRLVLGGYDDLLIEEGRMTLASMLQGQGYRTACIGKWHLGLNYEREGEQPMGFTMRDWEQDPSVRFDRPLRGGAHTVGFDYSFIIPSSLDIAPYVFFENGMAVEQPGYKIQASPRPAAWRAGSCAPGLQHETCLLEFTMRAGQFIADHAREKPEQPFFLYLPLPSPHTPHVPRKPFLGKSRCGTYGDFVVEHDWSIGQVLSALERAGLEEDTLVIITSDNGAHIRGSNFDFERDFGHRSNHIYRGQKSDAWDGGHRVPFFARWPGVVPRESECDQTLCLTDFMATCAEILDVSLPEDAAEDSASMLPVLRGSPVSTREAVVHHSIDGRLAIRKGKWKLLEGPGSGGWSLPDDTVPNDAPPIQLYDMETDPEEQTNLHARNLGVVAELTDLLDRYRRENRSV